MKPIIISQIMKNKILLFLCLMLCAAGLHAQDYRSKKIDSLLKQAGQIGIFNGNALVVQKGTTIYRNAIGFADGSKTKKLQSHMLFDIGSIAKEFNGVCIMILKEQGKLKLEDKLSLYFPELPSWASLIQIKQLLNYTSGLPSSSLNADEEILQEIKALKTLAYEPGKAYIYSYSNVCLQKKLIERISGMSYNAFVQRNLIVPLKLKHTIMDLPTDDPQMARAFNNSFVNESYRQQTTGWPRLTIDDLYTFITALNSYKIISKNSLEELSQNFPEGESSLGTARFENGSLVWHQHHGSNYNYEALVSTDLKDDISIILMTSNQNFKVSQLTQAIFAILRGQPYTAPKRSLYLDLREKVLVNFDQGMDFYKDARTNKKDIYDFSFEIGDLVNTGKYLMRRKLYDQSLRIFETGLALPIRNTDSSYVYQLMAECYVGKNIPEQARLYYQKAVDKDPGNQNAKGFLSGLGGKK
ncbi:serine hydrolase domain-containing protein [Pedobacter nutrimenti]|uniref:CubicO group peptidase (Beta-lactamase class C family) n=1 Tax=Pedobacter nutrimenti TaxID=1241337 RepID=A0A318UDG5_9SPHI|nr:serine hydrolase domain-containing protein [Pedobacter nutrimenti]PYF74462.1 CubicO group peptidase (beta-lactamase class C family) [Pedobacter nutrimenti]